MSKSENSIEFIQGSDEDSFTSPQKSGKYRQRIESSSSETDSNDTLSQSIIIDSSDDDDDEVEELSPVKVKNVVSQSIYNNQKEKVQTIERDLLRFQNISKTLDYSKLEDNGAKIKKKMIDLKNLLEMERKALNDMEVKVARPSTANEPSASAGATASAPVHKMKSIKEMLEAQAKKENKTTTWDEIQQGANAVQPRTFGKKAMATYNTQKTLTLNRLQQIHGSMKSRPADNDEAKDPEGLKIPLMPHQRRALKWLMWREKQRPSGGILADDMGLGKTLTMISLMLKSLEEEEGDSDEEERSDDEEDEEHKEISKNVKYNGGTLVVCPASLINQWSGELENRTRKGLASFDVIMDLNGKLSLNPCPTTTW